MPSDKDNAKQMTFWEHFEELRGVIFRIVILVVALAVVAFCIMRPFFDYVILAPCHEDFPTYTLLGFIKGDGDFLPDMSASGFDVSLMTINLGSQFMTHMSASLWLAFTVAFPLIIWLLWRFVSPALYEKERQGARSAFLGGLILFYTGVVVGYYLVFPIALRFLSSYQLSPDIAVNLTLDSYMDTFYMILLAMGVVFEIPLLSWMLGKIGLLNRRFFKKYRRHAIVICAALAAIITPTSDAFTLAVVFIPIYGLWEFSAFLVPPAGDKINLEQTS
ncbi:MAG: twin-arginine translocase subunit TatC [Muribaculaceae bacterium]|nr:twin-arginine translocase subunit TatC [Muribaculaceae bacterium]